MSSGLKWKEIYSYPSDANRMLFTLPSTGGYAAEHELEMEPDAEWYYSSGTTNIISMLINETIGEEAYVNFPDQDLFQKLGMYSAFIEKDASGIYVGSSFMWATPRDWVRYALLFYNQGIWNGERILPEGWVEYSSTPTAGADIGQYGAHFWLNAGENGNTSNRFMPGVPKDMYSMNGFEGQRVFIIPSKRLVILRMGQTPAGNFEFHQFVEEIVATVD